MKKLLGIMLSIAMVLSLAACGTQGVPDKEEDTTQSKSSSEETPPPDTASDGQEAVPYAYNFKPNPEFYSQYSSYGITILDDGETLLYNGQRVRLFVDEHSDAETFFLDEAGSLDLNVNRNTTGNIIGIKGISEQKAREYRSAFFADDTNSNVEVKETVQETVQDVIGKDKLELYSAYGISLAVDGGIMYYNGQRVKLLVDQLSDGSFETFWADEAGTASLSVVRNRVGEITSIKNITEEQAQKYQSSFDELSTQSK